MCDFELTFVLGFETMEIEIGAVQLNTPESKTSQSDSFELQLSTCKHSSQSNSLQLGPDRSVETNNSKTIALNHLLPMPLIELFTKMTQIPSVDAADNAHNHWN
jgi:hypothetical protein